MLAALTDRWWAVLINGLLAISFGAMALAWPGATLVALVVLFAVFCLVDGITALLAAGAVGSRERPWGHLLVAGLLSLAAGIAAFLWPGLTAVALLLLVWPGAGILALVWLIGVGALVRGILLAMLGLRLRSAGRRGFIPGT